jgi:hypothetical protein
MKPSARDFNRQWVTQCDAARTIRHRFGLVSALEYLVGEKLLHFVDASERHPDFKRELPRFLAEIKRLFSLTELESYIGASSEDRRSPDLSGLPCLVFRPSSWCVGGACSSRDHLFAVFCRTQPTRRIGQTEDEHSDPTQ